jgi:hypothetical protein
MILNVELERIWKEAALECFMELFQYFPGRIEKKHENSSGLSTSSSRFRIHDLSSIKLQDN